MPEDTETTQMQALFQKLAGNEAFSTLRGQWNRSWDDLARSMLDDTENPSQCLKRFDAFTRHARVMLNLLACLKRDGQTVFHEELFNALLGGTMSGEPVGLTDTTPITLVIPDPDRTLALIRWFSTKCDESLWECAYTPQGAKMLSEYDPSIRQPLLKNVSDVNDAFPDVLPEIASLLKPNTNGWRKRDETTRVLSTVFRSTVLTKFEEVLDPLGIPMLLNQPIRLDCRSTVSAPSPIAWVVKGKQKSVLNRFDRRTQAQLGTWSFELPTYFAGQQVIIGLHDETWHQECAARYPSLTSPGCQSKCGAFLCIPNEHSHPRAHSSKGNHIPFRAHLISTAKVG